MAKRIRVEVPERDMRLITSAAELRGETPEEFIIAAAKTAALNKLKK